MIARLERFERKGGTRPPRARSVRAKKPPEELAYLLHWYDICRGGQSRGMEVEPLSHQEIESFSNLHHLEITSFETTMMRRLDGPWFACLPKQDRATAPRAAVPAARPQSRPSPGLVGPR